MSSQAAPAQASSQESETRQVNVVDVDVTNENVALNVMVALLNMAQRRGVYTMQESAKAWECVQKFMRPVQASDSQTGETAAPADGEPNVTMEVNESA